MPTPTWPSSCNDQRSYRALRSDRFREHRARAKHLLRRCTRGSANTQNSSARVRYNLQNSETEEQSWKWNSARNTKGKAHNTARGSRPSSFALAHAKSSEERHQSDGAKRPVWMRNGGGGGGKVQTHLHSMAMRPQAGVQSCRNPCRSRRRCLRHGHGGLSRRSTLVR